MSFRDISGLVVCAGFYILPFVIIACFALSRLYKSAKWSKKVKTSEQIDKNCRGCIHSYHGNDYLYHCHVMEINRKFCNPEKRYCYKNGSDHDA